MNRAEQVVNTVGTILEMCVTGSFVGYEPLFEAHRFICAAGVQVILVPTV